VSHSLYEGLRLLADSWGLVALFVVFLGLVLWPLRPSMRERNENAARVIFEDDCDER
jgi:cytochrome c oxidase cbb3-type subunit 4